ncbi:methionyl-tRNA formyltransferase [Candidatus Peribacteria bacterium RIFCSPHIGHO2_01_FULL_51_35]|nr:MAG: methionyl-tRNA formyltransferase [Candidatus Peribacteria bacterium RIFCSPHIGHO2_01_FULL_51_35]
MKPFSVVFLGTSPFAVPSLQALLDDPQFKIRSVWTQPDRPAGRKQVLTPPPVKTLAQMLKIPVSQPEDINAEFNFDLKPDFLVVVSYGQILSDKILNVPSIAPVNVHASLLPHWRGASPLQHAILAGDTETGVTVQKIVQELDAGPVLGQTKTMIEPRETTPSLHDRLAVMGATLLTETLKNPLHPVEQDAKNVTLCKKLKREDGDVDAANIDATEIDRKVRALTPWPGVRATVQGVSLKLLETSLEAKKGSIPLVCAGGTTLHLVSVQEAGGKPMSGDEWQRGRNEKSGR